MKKIFSNKKNIVIIFSLLFIITIISTITILKSYPLKYIDEIKFIAEKYEIEAEMVAGIIYVESKFNCKAISSKGAIGIMQIMPETAKWICDKMQIPYSEKLLFNPLYNIDLGTFYIKYLKQKFQGTNSSIAAYNAGEGNVCLWLLNEKYTRDGDIITTPFKQTNSYLEKVNQAIEHYKKIF